MEEPNLMGCIRPAGKQRACHICGRTDTHGHRADGEAYDIPHEAWNTQPMFFVDEMVTEADSRRANIMAIEPIFHRGSSKTSMVGREIHRQMEELMKHDGVIREGDALKVIDFKTHDHADQMRYALQSFSDNIHRERLAAWGDAQGKRTVNEVRRKKDRKAAKLAKSARKRNR